MDSLQPASLLELIKNDVELRRRFRHCYQLYPKVVSAEVAGPEAQFISSTSSPPSGTSQTSTIRGLLELTCAELSCCDFVLVRADVFRSSDGLVA
jgi:hypothetical protein